MTDGRAAPKWNGDGPADTKPARVLDRDLTLGPGVGAAGAGGGDVPTEGVLTLAAGALVLTEGVLTLAAGALVLTGARP